jgi:YD repeat-containing protein
LYKYGYDSQQNLVSVIWPDGAKRHYVYADPRFPHALTGLIDEDGQRYASWIYDANGRAISSEHANGVDRYLLGYADNAAPATTITDPLGTSRTWNFTIVQSVFKNATVSQACGSCGSNITQSLRYDTNGDVISRTDFNNNVATYVFDSTRNLETSRTEAYGTPQSRTITTTWSTNFRLPTLITEPGRTTSYVYDDYGDVLSKTITDTTTGTARTTTNTYTTSADNTVPNLLKTVTDPNGHVTTYAYYSNGDLHTVTNALGQTTTITSYDANGRPLSLTDPNGLITSFTYSPRGRLTSKTVSSLVTNYSYDGVAQLTQVAYPSGQTYNYTYDAAHRLTDITDALNNHIHYTLDNMGNRTNDAVYNAISTQTSTHSRVFDSLNRLTIWVAPTTSNHLANISGATTNTWDASGDLLSQSGQNYTYDAHDRMASATTGNGTAAPSASTAWASGYTKKPGVPSPCLPTMQTTTCWTATTAAQHLRAKPYGWATPLCYRSQTTHSTPSTPIRSTHQGSSPTAPTPPSGAGTPTPSVALPLTTTPQDLAHSTSTCASPANTTTPKPA